MIATDPGTITMIQGVGLSVRQPGSFQGYRDTDASTLDSGAVLPAPDADDGYPEPHYSGTAAGSRIASASSTTAAPRQACRVSEG